MTITINSRVKALVDFFEPTEDNIHDLDWFPRASDTGYVASFVEAYEDHPAIYEIRFDADIDADEDNLSWTYLANELEEIDV